MAWQSTNPMFRSLTDAEVETFRQWARDNDPPSADWSLYHPICRETWTARGLSPEAPRPPEGPRPPKALPRCRRHGTILPADLTCPYCTREAEAEAPRVDLP